MFASHGQTVERLLLGAVQAVVESTGSLVALLLCGQMFFAHLRFGIEALQGVHVFPVGFVRLLHFFAVLVHAGNIGVPCGLLLWLEL